MPVACTPRRARGARRASKFVPRRALPVYATPAFPRSVLGETPARLQDRWQDAARRRRHPPVDAGRRGRHCQHQDQDARHQPRRGRRPGHGGRYRREGLQGRGGVVGRRALQRRCRPAGHAARLHDGRRQRHRRRRDRTAAHHAASCATPTCRWSRPSAAWHWAVAASWRCTRPAAWCPWKATSAWWKWAWAWCPAPVA